MKEAYITEEWWGEDEEEEWIKTAENPLEDLIKELESRVVNEKHCLRSLVDCFKEIERALSRYKQLSAVYANNPGKEEEAYQILLDIKTFLDEGTRLRERSFPSPIILRHGTHQREL